jgi:hypothetical protein
MNAKEIVDKFKSILLSTDEEVKEMPVVAEEVKLEEQEVLAEDMPADEAGDIVEDVVESEDIYATKEELAKAVAEMKAMYEQIMESMSTEEPTDAPAELAKEELSSQEEVAPLSHSPEEVVSSKAMNLYSQKRMQTTFDIVLSKISKQ